MASLKRDATSIFSLFTSFSTLLCCALPTLLVTLGLGAVVATTVSSFPLLITLSQNKEWMFLGAGIAIAVNFYLMYRREKKVACEIDPTTGEAACDMAAKWNKRVLWTSVAIYVIGFTVAFVAFPVLQFLGVL
ncbi:MAG: hypothetical protein ACE5H0_08340 [Bacteroidota bacterium]